MLGVRGGVGMTKPVVSNIRSIHYFGEKQLLEIRFHSGGSYRYLGVPADIYEKLMAADAKDEFLARHIRPKYRCSKHLIV
jgi:hypothetical protein